MSEASGMYVPTNLQWRIRSLANMSKTKIQITPTTPSTIGPNQKIQITLPYSSLLDLSTFSLEFTGETADGVQSGASGSEVITSLRFPRNTYSLIQEIQIKFNNVVVQHITDYNMIQNILFDIVALNQDAIGRAQCCGLNVDPSSKTLISESGTLSTYVGYATFAKTVSKTADAVKDKSTYFIKNFLGILQQGNVNVIDTSMIGQVQMTITFASAAVLGASLVTATDISIPYPTYKLSDIKANVMKIAMPPWYYEGLKNQLMNGTSYEMYFPHYTTFFGQSSQYKSQTTRFTIASDSLDYMIGTFIRADRDDLDDVTTMVLGDSSTVQTLGQVLVLGPTSPSFNQSVYFQRNGDEVISSQWTIGSEKLPQVPSTPMNCIQNTVEAFNLHQSADLGFYAGCKSVRDYIKYFFADTLSLSHVGDVGGTMLVSGLDSKSLPISLEWTTRASVTSGKASTDQVWLPLVICAETRHVTIGAGNQISIN